MSDGGQAAMRFRSLEDLLALAGALEREAAARYRTLSARMRRQGDDAMAAQFETLADIEDRHAVHVTNRSRALLGRAPDPAEVGWDQPAGHDGQEADGAALSAYRALAFAVRNEERAFAFYTYVAAAAVRADIRELAEDLARDELQHAAVLRHYRRRAFHADRPEAIELPGTVDALRAEARRRDADAAAAHLALAAILDNAGETDDAAIFRRLAAREAEAAGGTVAAAILVLRNAADGLRLLETGFDRYALIGERAADERVVAEAQRLAAEMVERLALAGGARHNTLLGASGG